MEANEQKKSNKKQKHIPTSFYLIYVETFIWDIIFEKYYLGKDVMEKFFDALEEVHAICFKR